MNEELERVFRKKYSTCVTNFSKELYEYLDALIDELNNRDLDWSKEQFERFAIEAMLWKATKLSSENKGKYKALHSAIDILEKTP